LPTAKEQISKSLRNVRSELELAKQCNNRASYVLKLANRKERQQKQKTCQLDDLL
jgi:hypothetical protein